jgi:hypothetical protein
MVNYTNFYNVKDVSLAIVTNVPSAENFDAVQSGVDENSQISFEGATDQISLKEDFTGQFADFSQKNSRRTAITITAMRGTPLHHKLSLIYEAQKARAYDVDLRATYKHPLDFNVKQFKGYITGYPRETIQGETDVLEYSLLGVANNLVDMAKKNSLL